MKIEILVKSSGIFVLSDRSWAPAKPEDVSSHCCELVKGTLAIQRFLILFLCKRGARPARPERALILEVLSHYNLKLAHFVIQVNDLKHEQF
jgi:hypothetical protein